MMIALLLFWAALGLILYTYLGFPTLVVLRALLLPRPIKRGAEEPTVSIILAAYNEAAFIKGKLDNTFALDYPREKIEVIVASDGSDDGTDELVASYGALEVSLLALPRQGKNLTLNNAVATARGDILVFTDADCALAPETLHHLISPFSDPEVGGVAGEHRIARLTRLPNQGRAARGLKHSFKDLLSLAGSVTSAEGAIYAIRRNLFKPLPASVADDFYTSAQVITAKYRLVFESRAVAYELAAPRANTAFQRKTRVISKFLDALWHVRHLLNPLQYGYYAIQLISHKLLQRLAFVSLVILLVATLVLWQEDQLYQIAGATQLTFYGAALLGFLLRKGRLGRLKVFRLPFVFINDNAASMLAFANLIRGNKQSNWITQRASLALARRE